MRSCGESFLYTSNNSIPVSAEDSISNRTLMPDSLSVIMDQLNGIHPHLQEYYDGYKNNDPKSTCKLAKCFETGAFLQGKVGYYTRIKIAGMLFHRAADSGFAEAQTSLGYYFYNGRGEFEQNYDSATFWYKEAIKNGSHDAEYYLANAYSTGTYSKNDSTLRTKDAIELYKNSAKGGNANSQIALGIYYYDYTNNYSEAKTWLESGLSDSNLSDKSRAKAQFYMGQLYGTGKAGVEHDETKALEWYEKSASTGDGYLEAIYYSGLYYEKGRGTAPNPGKAKYYYQRAADRDHDRAKKKLNNFK